MTDNDFLRLATLYLEDAIDQSDLELLHLEFANSPDRVRQFNDLRLLTGLIHEHGRELAAARDDFPTSKAVSSGHVGPSAASDRGQGGGVAKRIGIVTAILATAASLLLVWSWPNSSSRRDEVTHSIATLAYVSHARWGVTERSLGDSIGKEKIRLDVGLARLDFQNGATVTLQGPAELEVLSKDKTRLNAGILTASIPESAVGFEVVTPAMDVVDKGTAFGVAVGMDGETDVCVFEGEVEVSRSGDPSKESTRLLKEGNALRWSPEARAIAPVDYNTNRYEEAWPVTSGVLQATGLMKFVAPGPEFVPGRYEDNERVLVFLERADARPSEDFFVDLIEPGLYQRIHRSESHRISAGTHLRSYLLQLDPIGKLARDAANKPRVMGQVTFDRPVIGLIASSSKLSATDELLGHPRGDYVKTRRGIEPPSTSDPSDVQRDVVILSKDRQTLSVDLSAGTAIDQIRVIVEGREQPNEPTQD